MPALPVIMGSLSPEDEPSAATWDHSMMDSTTTSYNLTQPFITQGHPSGIGPG
jgi:hypothetical protein